MRPWQGRKNDDGAVHSLGNGLMCVYQQGPDVIQLFWSPLQFAFGAEYPS